jgi:hypothetical protein
MKQREKRQETVSRQSGGPEETAAPIAPAWFLRRGASKNDAGAEPETPQESWPETGFDISSPEEARSTATAGPVRGGAPLSGSVRSTIESILGTPVGPVRIHRGPAAERAAAAYRTTAFTYGQDVVLGARAPDTRHGVTSAESERLLAHEVAHTVQQSAAPPAAPHELIPTTHPGGWEECQADAAARGMQRPTPGAPRAIAAAPPITELLAPTERFKDLWPEFERARYALDRPKATTLAKQLATAPHDFDDLLTHGIDVFAWLQRNGEPGLAGRFLEEVRSVWLIQFVSKGKKLPDRTTLSWSSSDPATLIALAKETARAGKHTQAFEMFGVANELLSYYAISATQRRQATMENDEIKLTDETLGDPVKRKAIEEALFLPRAIARSSQYSNLAGIYDQMREIYGFYYVLEKELRTAGDAQGATEARAKATELHDEIKKKYTWGTTQQKRSISQEIRDPVEVRDAVEIAEVSYTDTKKGGGLKLHGANTAETTLTQLPGLPAPKEIGNNIQIQNLGALQGALLAQTDFHAEIGRVPEIQKAFGDKPIDMNNTPIRQKVWRIMFGVYQQSGSGALGSLMALIGRYLQAFTIHTSYNVRDWGKSYLDSEMPTDLTGRAERDCGVYALTVAWDVYQALTHSGSKLDVTFDLTTMLEHVTLVINDKTAGEFYVVNNDQVSPAHKGDPLTQIAPLYQAIRGLAHTVGPAVTVSLGSTKDPRRRFHDLAWERYLAAVDWGIEPTIPPEVAQLERTDPAAFERQVAALHEDRYKNFYRDQAVFDRAATAMKPLIDALATDANDVAKFGAALSPLVDVAGQLAVLFYQLGPGAGVVAGSKKSQKILPKRAEFLFTMPQGTKVHPLTRVALAILHLQALGATPTPKQDAFLQFCAKIPMFKQQMDAYTAAGAMGPF